MTISEQAEKVLDSLRKGQRVSIVKDGKLHDQGLISSIGPGGEITTKEVRILCDSLGGEEMVFRFFEGEQAWRYFFEDPFTDTSIPGDHLCFSHRGPTYRIEGLN